MYRTHKPHRNHKLRNFHNNFKLRNLNNFKADLYSLIKLLCLRCDLDLINLIFNEILNFPQLNANHSKYT